MRHSESQFLQVRGLRYHVRHWRAPGAPKLVLLHGWMDVSASFQFVVDALEREWDVYAPQGVGQRLEATLAGQMEFEYFPVALKQLGAKVRYHDLVEGTFLAGGVHVTARYWSLQGSSSCTPPITSRTRLISHRRPAARPCTRKTVVTSSFSPVRTS